ncbi:Hypothetical Protein FCC1311_097202 [Hondaea fermentalgiana]|uniref:Uncharacterized protein n=1 Tax=Hondaea fermentalgiana TaxID=2315210 RepID=A0A2R5GRJ1_9STRA|nr:Hypothetical Protein FCC1311_097202 [Hondaea fermentalgiana]|eukprot:GBG33497.1 Hypothetical Protein FCC1311_097202 [Hondaea fermentalgiana]
MEEKKRTQLRRHLERKTVLGFLANGTLGDDWGGQPATTHTCERRLRLETMRRTISPRIGPELPYVKDRDMDSGSDDPRGNG